MIGDLRKKEGQSQGLNIPPAGVTSVQASYMMRPVQPWQGSGDKETKKKEESPETPPDEPGPSMPYGQQDITLNTTGSGVPNFGPSEQPGQASYSQGFNSTLESYLGGGDKRWYMPNNQENWDNLFSRIAGGEKMGPSNDSRFGEHWLDSGPGPTTDNGNKFGEIIDDEKFKLL